VLATTTVLAYGFGYMGMMLSPVHICFVVTNEFFKSRFLIVYRQLVGPVCGVLLGTIVLALLYSRLWGKP